jgi:hypothetical protein
MGLQRNGNTPKKCLTSAVRAIVLRLARRARALRLAIAYVDIPLNKMSLEVNLVEKFGRFRLSPFALVPVYLFHVT